MASCAMWIKVQKYIILVIEDTIPSHDAMMISPVHNMRTQLDIHILLTAILPCFSANGYAHIQEPPQGHNDIHNDVQVLPASTQLLELRKGKVMEDKYLALPKPAS